MIRRKNIFLYTYTIILPLFNLKYEKKMYIIFVLFSCLWILHWIILYQMHLYDIYFICNNSCLLSCIQYERCSARTRCDFFALRLLYTFVTRSEDDHPRSVWQPAVRWPLLIHSQSSRYMSLSDACACLWYRVVDSLWI